MERHLPARMLKKETFAGVSLSPNRQISALTAPTPDDLRRKTVTHFIRKIVPTKAASSIVIDVPD
jgi:hypothetical protein